MPTNKKGGKGFKKAKKNSFQSPTFETAIEGQFYAKIEKKLGDRRFSIVLHGTGEKCNGRARGSLKGWHNMKKDDIVLISSRDFRNSENESFVQDTYDIIQYFLPEHVRKLIKMGELTDSAFTDIGDSNIEIRDMYEEDESSDEGIAPQRAYDLPESDDEEEDSDFEIDDL